MQSYRMKKSDYIRVFLEAAGISGLISFLFYESMWAMLQFPIVYVICLKLRKEAVSNKQKEQVAEEFIEFLRNISASLLAGYSMENAWIEGEKEIGTMYGRESVVYKELKNMNRAVKLNEPLEKCLDSFAQRTEVEEIINFAEIFSFAKRSGGNFISIIDRTSYRLCEKYEVKREINVMIAAKKYEQKIMSLIPLGILFYLKLVSREYISILYGSLFGVVFMSICLMVYLLSLILSRKILEIQV